MKSSPGCGDRPRAHPLGVRTGTTPASAGRRAVLAWAVRPAPLQLADQLVVASELEVGIEAGLQRAQPCLLQADNGRRTSMNATSARASPRHKARASRNRSAAGLARPSARSSRPRLSQSSRTALHPGPPRARGGCIRPVGSPGRSGFAHPRARAAASRQPPGLRWRDRARPPRTAPRPASRVGLVVRVHKQHRQERALALAAEPNRLATAHTSTGPHRELQPTFEATPHPEADSIPWPTTATQPERTRPNAAGCLSAVCQQRPATFPEPTLRLRMKGRP